MLIKETLDKFYQTIKTGFKVIKGEKIWFWYIVHNYTTCTQSLQLAALKCAYELYSLIGFSALILTLLGWILNIESMTTENEICLLLSRSNAGMLNFSDVNL